MTMTCGHTPFAQSLQEVETVAVTSPARSKVYTFFMNGSDIFEIDGMAELRDQIVANGFSKVYYAQRPDREWYRRELHRLHRDDPEARFVLVAYGTAADQTLKLATQVTGEQIPLEAVMFIDPAGLILPHDANAGYRTLTIRSQRWRGSPGLRTGECIEVPGVRHLSLPKSPATVSILTDLLTSIALTVPVPRAPGQCPPLSDKPNPVPRPDVPMRIPVAPPEWQFLCPPGGNGVSNCLQGQ